MDWLIRRLQTRWNDAKDHCRRPRCNRQRLVIKGIGGIDAQSAVILLSPEAISFVSVVLPGFVLIFA